MTKNLSSEEQPEEQPEEGAAYLQPKGFVDNTLCPICHKKKYLCICSKSEPAGEKMQDELWYQIIDLIGSSKDEEFAVEKLKSKYIIQKREP